MFSLCVFCLCVFSLCFLSVCFLSVFSVCVFSLCVFSLCFLSVFCLCVFSVFSLCLLSVCFLSLCFLSVCFLSAFVFSVCFLLVFSVSVFSLCVFCLCFMSVCFLSVFSVCVFCLCVFSLCFLSVFSPCVFSLCFLSMCFLSVFSLFSLCVFCLCVSCLCVSCLCVFCVCFLSVFSLCLLSLRVFSLCVFSLCLCFLCVFCLCFLSVFSLCVFCLCFLSVFSLCVFSVCVFSVCVFSLCFLSVFSACVFCLCFLSVCFLSVFSLCVFCLRFLSVCFLSAGVICCDCLSAVHIADDLLTQLRSRVTPELPLEHLDLWSWFLEGLAECELGSLHFRWVKGHTSWKKTHGLARLHAWYNHWADRAAAEAGKWVFELPAYHSLVRRYMARRRISRLVHDYQVQVAFTFAQKDKIVHPEPVPVTFRVGYGFPLSPYGACIEGAAFKHEGFARKLVCWLEGLQWFQSAVGFPHCDTSWLELFWGFIRDTSCLPPFRVGSSWVSVDDDITFGFALPSVKALFRTWRCCLDSLVRCGLVLPWVVLPTTQSAVSLGARFACPGISGHVALPSDVRVDLSFQFARSRCLADLRVPSFY